MRKSIIILICLFIFSSCEDILEQSPKGVISSENFDNPVAVEGLVTSAYAMLDNVNGSDGFFPPISAIFYPASNWSYSDVRSDDAYKGGGGTGDIGELNSIELGIVAPTNFLIERKWEVIYFAISRCNKALRALNEISDELFPAKQQRIAEVRALRGHYYFELKRHFFVYPYLDENVLPGTEPEVANDLNSDQLWDLIIADFQAAASVLPADQGNEVGRVNRFMPIAYLCKVYMFRQDYTNALTQADLVINSGQYRLLDDLQALYSDPAVEHDGEHIFAMETNIGGGGTEGGNYNWGDLLTSPPGPAYGGGDGFHRPSQNLVNAFKVDPTSGLPLFDTFNASDLAPDDSTTAVDPRLDHAIGRPGIPWKDYTEGVYGNDWIREGATYGPYSKKKNIILVNSSLRGPQPFPWAQGAKNFPFIKYSDILLWKAEALVELNQNLDEARNLVNQIRQRAANSAMVAKLGSTENASNYQIGLYPSTGWTQDLARQAVRFERRLELCLEGHRFYDLVRWGVAEQVIDAYYQSESQKRPYLGVGDFIPNQHEFLPIPQNQIDLSNGVLMQNPFY